MLTFKATDFVSERRIGEFNQVDHLKVHGVCLALSLYWLRRCSKMSDVARLPSDSALKLKHQGLCLRLWNKFEKIERMQQGLEVERDKWTTKRKADRAVLQAQARLDRDRTAGKDPKSSEGLVKVLQRKQNQATAAVVETRFEVDDSELVDRAYEQHMALEYNLSLGEPEIAEIDADTGRRMTDFLLQPANEMALIGAGGEHGAHAMAAYRARATSWTGYVFFDPNTGSHLCSRADGPAFFDRYLACYRRNGAPAYDTWSIQRVSSR